MEWRHRLISDMRAVFSGPPERFEAEGEPWRGPRYLRPSRHLRDLLAVTEQLGSAVAANASIGGACDAATADAPSYHLKRLFAALADDTEMGWSLWESLKRRPRFFPDYYTGLVKAGEESGRLGDSFAALRAVLMDALDLRMRAIHYAAYIGVVWLVVITLTALIASYVLPTFNDILKDFGARMPALYLFWADAWSGIPRLAGALVLIPLAYLGARLLGGLARRFRIVGAVFGWLALRTPLLRSLFAQRNLAHAARVVETLLRARVPLDEALGAAAGLGINPIYGGALDRARQRVNAGEPLHEALAREKAVPASFRGFVSVGENAGRLPEALARLDHLYRRQVSRTERVVLDVVSPLGILAAGAVVLTVFLTLMLSITSMLDSLSSF